MSVPSPNFPQILKAVSEFIALQEGKLNILNFSSSEDLDSVSQVFRSVFNEIEERILKRTDWGEREIELLSENMSKSTSAIVASPIFQNISEQDQEKYLKIQCAINEELDSFKELVLHQAELNEKGLGYYLDQPWGWKQLEQLAKMGQLWALETLKSLVEQNHQKASLFLINNASDFNHLDLLYEVKDFFIPYLQQMLSTSEEKDKAIVYNFIKMILAKQNWMWGQKILEERFDSDNLAAFTLRDLFMTTVGTHSSIESFILEKLLQDHPIAIDGVARVFSDEGVEAEHLIEPLTKLALEQGSFEFDMLLLSLATFSDLKLLEKVVSIINQLEAKHNNGKKQYAKILDYLISKHDELEEDSFEAAYNHQTHMSVHDTDFVTVRAYQLFALREHQLINWLDSGQVTEETPSPISDCFPHTSAMIVGKVLKNTNFFEEISRLLKAHSISIYSTIEKETSSTLQCRSGDNLLLQSDRALPGWIRDYFFVLQDKISDKNRFYYPHWMQLGDAFSDLTFTRVEKRYADDPDKLMLPDLAFSNLGTVAKYQSQLNMLSYLLNANPQLSFHRFQLTYNEGGNCLIGQFQGKPYALIGKNAMKINEISLKMEIAKLGYKKNEQGRWEHVDDDIDEDDVDLTEDDLKVFFALDLGIEDPSRIYFVEQADYHLDMAMAILEDKTIILNDSMLSYEIMEAKFERKEKRQAAKKVKLENSDKDGLKTLEKRLENLFNESQKMKLVEDMAEQDLLQQGFKVIRIAGVFVDIFKSHPENHQSNLFNFVSLTTPEGKKVIVSLGCSIELQDKFKKVIAENIQETVEIHFLDQNQSEALLEKKGGIHCITKCLPYQL